MRAPSLSCEICDKMFSHIIVELVHFHMNAILIIMQVVICF